MSSFIFPLESVKTGTFELEEVVSTKISVRFKKGIVVVSVIVEEVVDDVVIDRVQKILCIHTAWERLLVEK